jgi:hypothetical protein
MVATSKLGFGWPNAITVVRIETTADLLKALTITWDIINCISQVSLSEPRYLAGAPLMLGRAVRYGGLIVCSLIILMAAQSGSFERH